MNTTTPTPTLTQPTIRVSSVATNTPIQRSIQNNLSRRQIYLLILYNNKKNNEIFYKNLLSIILTICIFLIFFLNVINYIFEKHKNIYEKIFHTFSIIFTTMLLSVSFFK
jgi:hypothetical protein